MKLALCNEVLRGRSFEEQCAYAAALGYDGLEIAPFTLTDDPESLSGQTLAAARRALAAEGLACAGLHWLLAAPEGLSITTPETARRRRTLDLMRRLVDVAAELGAGVLVHGSPRQRTLSPGDEAGARERAIGCFRLVAEAAARAGITYCLEPLAREETAFVTTLTEAADIVRSVESPGLAAMIDCAATARNGADVVATLEEWYPTGLIRHVHVNDPNRRGPGEGTLRFAPVLATLRDHGYAGWVSVEPFVYRPEGPAVAARSAGYLRGLAEALA